MLKRFFTLNFLDAFMAGMTVVLVPLLMQAKGIDVATIGLVFAAAPIVKLVVRLAGASLADFAGDRIIYSGNAGANLLQALCYIVASSPLAFAAGKLFDGARESLIFSVNRASLMVAAPEKKHFVLAGLMSGRFVYNAIGGLAVGLLFSIGGFDLPLALIAVLSAYMLLSTISMKDMHRTGAHPKISDFSLSNRGRRFYETAAALAVGGSVYISMLYMLMPIYFSWRGFSLAEIGIFYSAYFLVNGVSMNALSHRKTLSGKLALAGGALFAISLPAILLAPNSLVPYLFVLMAIGDGCLGVLWEEMNYLAVRKSHKRATDLALLNTPSYIAIFAVTAASGFSVSLFGYAPLFAAFALTEVLFSAWALRLSRMKD